MTNYWVCNLSAHSVRDVISVIIAGIYRETTWRFWDAAISRDWESFAFCKHQAWFKYIGNINTFPHESRCTLSKPILRPTLSVSVDQLDKKLHLSSTTAKLYVNVVYQMLCWFRHSLVLLDTWTNLERWSLYNRWRDITGIRCVM